MKAVKDNNITKYYKYGSPNATVKGSPTISKGVVSGFSTSNYLDIPASYKKSVATYVFKFTPTALPASGSYAYLVHSENFLDIYIYSSGNLVLYTWGDDTHRKIETMTLNQTYWLKVDINGTTIKCSLSSDGINYTEKKTATDTKINPSNTTYPIRLGLSSATSKEPFIGSIDLTECYIAENGVKIWSGIDVNTGTPTDYDFTKVGVGYKLIKETVRKIDTKWIQPILSSNGTFGGDTMAVTSSVSPKNGSLYQLFDGSTSNFCRMADAQYVYVTVYFPTPIKITGVKIINHHNSSNGFGITAFEVQNSSDNSAWQTIGSTSITLADGATATATCATDNYFKYMRLKLTSSTTYGYQASMKEITIYAEKQINDSSYKDVVLYKAMR